MSLLHFLAIIKYVYITKITFRKNKLMKTSKNIIYKLKLLSILPMIVLSIAFILFSIHSYHTLNHLNGLKKDVAQSKEIAFIINELQIERGLSVGYVASKGSMYKDKLLKQRRITNSVNVLNLINKKQKKVIENKINILSISDIDVFNYYTFEIKKLLKKYMSLTTGVENIFVKKNLQAYTNLSVLKESLGQMRAAFNGILSSAKEEKIERFNYKMVYAKAIYDSSKERFMITLSPDILNDFNAIVKSKKYSWVESTINNYTINHTYDKNITSFIWWKNITTSINMLFKLERKYFLLIDTYVEDQFDSMIIELSMNALLFVILLFAILLLSSRIQDSILRNINMLNQYKDAVDRSSIVSKTDAKGLITYANDKFCEISGYTLQELLGKSHNMIRHVDMPKEIFSQMWKDISQKKAWHGIVKNKKKDGGIYIVDATINPILNHKNEIEEFIAIRNDITEVYMLHKELEETQQDLILRVGYIAENRSIDTGDHVKRVTKYSEIFAKYSDLSKDEVMYFVMASPMHDIGKIGIPDTILNKPAKLNEEEWKVMKTHTDIGYDFFRDSDKPLFKAAAIIAYEHHEKYDGSGYPRGLKGDAIHIYGRITALADVFDALSTKRCYKSIWTDEKIFTLIKEEKGKHFDPQLVDIFFEHIDEFLAIREQYNA